MALGHTLHLFKMEEKGYILVGMYQAAEIAGEAVSAIYGQGVSLTTTIEQATVAALT